MVNNFGTVITDFNREYEKEYKSLKRYVNIIDHFIQEKNKCETFDIEICRNMTINETKFGLELKGNKIIATNFFTLRINGSFYTSYKKMIYSVSYLLGLAQKLRNQQIEEISIRLSSFSSTTLLRFEDLILKNILEKLGIKYKKGQFIIKTKDKNLPFLLKKCKIMESSLSKILDSLLELHPGTKVVNKEDDDWKNKFRYTYGGLQSTFKIQNDESGIYIIENTLFFETKLSNSCHYEVVYQEMENFFKNSKKRGKLIALLNNPK